MKNKRGVTLIALILTIMVMAVIVGITVKESSDVLQKSKMTDYIGYMKLVQARADEVFEEEVFEDKSSLTGEITYSGGAFTGISTEINNVINTKGYNNNNVYGIIKWEKSQIASQGIDSNILGNDEYFVIIYDKNSNKTKDVIYSTGCAMKTQRFYSLKQMSSAMNKKLKVENLIKDGGIENGKWGKSWTTPNWEIDTNIVYSGKKALLLKGDSQGETYVANNTMVPVKKNHKYYMSFYSYLNGNAGGTLIQVFWNLNGAHYRHFELEANIKNDWVKNSHIFTSDIDDKNYLRLDFNNGDINNTIRYDNIVLVDLTELLDWESEPVRSWNDAELQAWCDANLEYGVTEVAVPTN